MRQALEIMRRINTHSLRWLGVIVPLSFWSLWIVARTLVWGQPISWPATLLELLLISAGAILFANWVALNLEQGEAEIRRRSEHLEALREAALALTTELDLAKVLQRVVDLSRTLVDARYGALAVFAPDNHTVESFYVSGMSEDAHPMPANLPSGVGLLGVLSDSDRPIRLSDIGADARAIGFPPGHPPMRTLLGVPILSKGRRFGNLYLTDKRVISPSAGTVNGEFTLEDQDLLAMFATQAAIAIENAQLYQENQQIAVLRERERIGMDLHDGVIQSIYAIGLLLDDARHRIDSAPQQSSEVMAAAIRGLNEVILDIRNYIQNLRPQRFQNRNVKQGLEELVREIHTDTLLSVDLEVDGQAVNACSARQVDEFLHVAQEALTNVRKHADATTVRLQFGFKQGMLQLTVEDNGAGLTKSHKAYGHGNGLRNMRNRARALHGEFRLEAAGTRGIRVVVTAPIEKRNA